MAKKKIAKKSVKKVTRKAVKKATQGRAPGKTQISISLPTDLVEQVDQLAAAENRNRSNFIATSLEALDDQ